MHLRRRPPLLGTTFVDEEAERAKAGLWIAVVVGFVVSGWSSLRELNYLVRGQTVEASVRRTYEFTVPTKSGPSRPRLAVEYVYRDAAEREHADRDWVAAPSELAGAATVRVQYLPGPAGDSRLAVNRRWLGLAIFGGCLAVVLAGLIRLVHEAWTPISAKRTLSKSRRN